jgi:hypothetical protein
MKWHPIDTAPIDGRQILVGFHGQYDWYSYVAPAHGSETGRHLAFAPPTHWTDIKPPVDSK